MTRGKTTTCLALTGAALLTIGLGASLTSPASAADEESVLGESGGSLILVLDGSGSMEEPAGEGETRMEAAKSGLNGVIDDLPQDSQVGLRVYGSTISDGPGSCEDSELLVPVEEMDEAALRDGVDELEPLGNTPIAYSLEQAYDDLPSEGPRSIVLVSDGEENCGGDPCRVAGELQERGADFYVDVVGLQVDAASRNQLTCIASAGGGTYYDVKDINELPSALTRTSVRAARGYKPAGLPIEGGTDAGAATTIENGQWLDTIGDTGEEFYALPDPAEGTVHVSAATPPSVESDTAAETIELAVESASGTPCGPGGRAFVQGASNAGSPLSVGYSLTPELVETCGEGPYVARVTAPEVTGVQPLEVLVRVEPAVESTQGLPPGSDAGSGFSDDAEGQAPSGEPVSVIGGPNFSSAPPTVPGSYTDSVLAGETLFYRVPDVGWGQQAVCDFSLGDTPAAEGALGSRGYRLPVAGRLFGPLKSPIVDAASQRGSGQYDGGQATEVHVASPVVAYLNRDSGQEPPRAAALDGDYYCSVTALPVSVADAGDIGEIPVTLTVDVVGEVAGEPEYASEPEPTANEAAEDEAAGGPGWIWLAVGAVVLLGLVGALLAVLRRRGRGSQDAPVDATAGPPPAG